MTQKKFQKMMVELAPLRGLLYPRAGPGYLRDVARRIWIMEASGATHFGGPDVFAWYLTDRARKGDSHQKITSYLARRWDERNTT